MTFQTFGVRAARAMLATTAFALALGATSAFAGECPNNQGRNDGEDVMAPGPNESQGVTDQVLSMVKLDNGNMFRLRRLEIAPGGIVADHSHAERPANIYIQEGSIVEYRSDCKVPVVHNAGESTAEFGSFSHSWQNESNAPVIIISTDIVTPAMMADEEFAM